MIDRILFATDFSPLSDRAEQYAIELAKALVARLEVVHAITPVEGPEDDPELERFMQQLRERDLERLEAVVERIGAHGVEVGSFLTVGAPWEVILERAEEIGANLIVLGSHGLREGERVYVGTTSHRVLFNSAIPVLVVRPEEPDEAGA